MWWALSRLKNHFALVPNINMFQYTLSQTFWIFWIFKIDLEIWEDWIFYRENLVFAFCQAGILSRQDADGEGFFGNISGECAEVFRQWTWQGNSDINFLKPQHYCLLFYLSLEGMFWVPAEILF